MPDEGPSEASSIGGRARARRARTSGTQNERSPLPEGSGLAFFDGPRTTDELDLVRSGLDDTMRLAYQQMSEELHTNDRITDFRTAAYAVAIKKIARSYLDIGVY